MKANHLKSLLVLGLCVAGVVLGPQASAATVSCSDATAQGSTDTDPRFADDCKFLGDPSGSGAQTSAVNAEWQGVGGAFTYIGKWDYDKGAKEEQENTGFSLTVEILDPPETVLEKTYELSYELAATGPEFAGKTIDWVLGLKDGASAAGGGFAGYLWNTITLDISGNFKSFFQVNDLDTFSHISGFYRLVADENDEPPAGVPEPMSLALFGAGLLGLGWAMRRRNQV